MIYFLQQMRQQGLNQMPNAPNANPNQPQNPNQSLAMQQAMMQQQGIPTSQPQQVQPNQVMPGAPQAAPPREKIWSGILEWVEKSKSEQGKVPHQVPCYVTAKENDIEA